jgi:hypothetical protein
MPPHRPSTHEATIEALPMPKYLIEREIPGAGKLTRHELMAISQQSCGVLQNMGPQIQWVQSFVTGDKITCVYIAPSAEMVREHARQGGFPANRVEEITTIIDPTTAEAPAAERAA